VAAIPFLAGALFLVVHTVKDDLINGPRVLAEFRKAPGCTDTAVAPNSVPECRMVSCAVTGKYTERPNRYVHYIVELEEPSGRLPRLYLDQTQWSLLSAGEHVTAKTWRGDIIEARFHGLVVRTYHHPEIRYYSSNPWPLVVCFTLAFCGACALFYKIFRDIGCDWDVPRLSRDNAPANSG
jgi:hypothetical protein